MRPKYSMPSCEEVVAIVATEQLEWERLLLNWDKATEDIARLLTEAEQQEKEQHGKNN